DGSYIRSARQCFFESPAQQTEGAAVGVGDKTRDLTHTHTRTLTLSLSYTHTFTRSQKCKKTYAHSRTRIQYTHTDTDSQLHTRMRPVLFCLVTSCDIKCPPVKTLEPRI